MNIRCLYLGLAGFIASAPGMSAAGPDYAREIAPLLRQYCAGCHNDEDFEGDLSVETYAAFLEGGAKGDAFKAGDVDGSRMIKMMTGRSKKPMPPEDDPQLAKEELEVFKKWVATGGLGPKNDESILASLTVPDIKPGKDSAEPVTAAEGSPDGKHLAVARYGQVDLVAVGELKGKLKSFGPHPGKINAVHFSRDGKRLITASGITGLNGVATLWNIKTGKKIREFSGHRDVLYDAEISPDGKRLATAGYDRAIVIWDLESGKKLRTIKVHNGAIFDLAFSPDGKVLASASADETVKLWQVESGKRLDTLPQPLREQFSVAFTPDGKYVLAAGGDNRIRMWRFLSKDKARINPLVTARFAHEGAVVKIVVSPDGKTLLSASEDHSIKEWSLPDLVQVRSMEGQPDVASALVMDLKGPGFTVGRLDGSVKHFARVEGGKSGVKVKAAAKTPKVMAGASKQAKVAPGKMSESEPNDQLAKAMQVKLPVEVEGTIGKTGDSDLIRFTAKAGEQWMVEVKAARDKSPLDSMIEVLDAEGKLVERVRLQALRDSWFTFRGKNSATSDDFRVHNWEEMDLNDYLYANGEVVKLWLYPRGPDSGFKVYPGYGSRFTYFGSSPLAHPLGEPCYIVRPIPAGSDPIPNGLPVFTMYFENDDDAKRRWGDDSQLMFSVPEDGEYMVRIKDVRGFGGKDFKYKLTVRERRPDFNVKVAMKDLAISPGGGKEFSVTAERLDNFEGEIKVDVSNLPPGFLASSPIVIEKGQYRALGVINAAGDVKEPGKDQVKAIKLVASALVAGKSVTHEAGSLGEIKLGKKPKVLVEIIPSEKFPASFSEPGKPLEFTIHPGQTITARVRVKRDEFKDRIPFGRDDAVRNLGHGLYLKNVGLSGLLIVEGQTEREFFIAAAKWAPESTRQIFLQTSADGKQASWPVIIHVKREGKVASVPGK